MYLLLFLLEITKGNDPEYFGIQNLTPFSEGKGKLSVSVKPYVGEVYVLGACAQNSRRFLQ